VNCVIVVVMTMNADITIYDNQPSTKLSGLRIDATMVQQPASMNLASLSQNILKTETEGTVRKRASIK